MSHSGAERGRVGAVLDSAMNLMTAPWRMHVVFAAVRLDLFTRLTSDPIGENLDVVLLSDVVYEEKTAGPILKNALSGMKENGLLIVRGYYADPEQSRPLFGALFVLGQLVFDPARSVLTIIGLRDAVQDAGFTVTRCAGLTERSFLLTARKG